MTNLYPWCDKDRIYPSMFLRYSNLPDSLLRPLDVLLMKLWVHTLHYLLVNESSMYLCWWPIIVTIVDWMPRLVSKRKTKYVSLRGKIYMILCSFCSLYCNMLLKFNPFCTWRYHLEAIQELPELPVILVYNYSKILKI